MQYHPSYHIYLIDDSHADLAMIKTYLMELEPNSIIETFCSNKISAEHIVNDGILFIDCNLNETADGGYRIAEKIKRSNKTVRIVFISWHDNFVFDYQQFSYKFYFVRKSNYKYDIERIFTKISAEYLSIQKVFNLKNTKECDISVTDVILAHSQGNYVELVYPRSNVFHSIYVLNTFKNVESELNSFLIFAKVNKGLLVNCRYLVSCYGVQQLMGKSQILIYNNFVVRISRKYKNSFNSKIVEVFNESI